MGLLALNRGASLLRSMEAFWAQQTAGENTTPPFSQDS
jgi:hypothetical protein